jgi:V-type H+-transporting ATPase subunit a
VSCAQVIIEQYGVAHYREINPAPLAVVTFPCFFAIMFGDVGHGLLLLFISLFVIAMEKRLEKQELNEIVGMIFYARYMLLLMALWYVHVVELCEVRCLRVCRRAIYVGLLYNEAFAVGLEIFGPTHWHTSNNPDDDSLQVCVVLSCGSVSLMRMCIVA